MYLDLTNDELLTTTRTVRKRLDCERPVEHDVIEDCVRIAMQTPSGANQQGWHRPSAVARRRRGSPTTSKTCR